MIVVVVVVVVGLLSGIQAGYHCDECDPAMQYVGVEF
jgi:hypothetical protein